MKSYKDWLMFNKINENTSLNEWCVNNNILNEQTTGRYSIEVNFRSKLKEILKAYAKISLGYVGAALKQNGYHIKHVYEQDPVRIIISKNNWIDGTWVGIIYFHPDYSGGSFIIGKGYYNKDVKTISLQDKKKCSGDSAAEITAEARKLMFSLKDEPDRHSAKLKGISLKRGPKK